MLIGYARVSTDDQNLSLQRDALTKAGCKRIFTDKASSAPVQRPGLADALSHLRKGDSLVVWKLDRLGRSVKGLVGVTTRKCQNCPAREAAAMLPRSAIRVGTGVSRCPGGGEGYNLQKGSVSRSKSDNQAAACHLGTTTRCPPRCLPAAQSARIHAQRLKSPVLVLSNRTILTLSCRHPKTVRVESRDATGPTKNST
jgi:hypothetical protein